MEAESRVVHPQAKECWQPQKMEEAKNRFSLRTFEEHFHSHLRKHSRPKIGRGVK